MRFHIWPTTAVYHSHNTLVLYTVIRKVHKQINEDCVERYYSVYAHILDCFFSHLFAVFETFNAVLLITYIPGKRHFVTIAVLYCIVFSVNYVMYIIM